MMLPFRRQRGQYFPPGQPRIDWSHPLTDALLFCAVDTGNGPLVDLVNGRRGTIVGSRLASMPSAHGTTFQHNGSANGVRYAMDPLIRYNSAPLSYACAFKKTGNVGAYSTPFCRTQQDNTAPPYVNWCFEINGVTAGQNKIEQAFATGGVNTAFGAAWTFPGDNLYTSVVGTLGSNGKLYGNGVLQVTTTGTYSGANTTDDIYVGCVSSTGGNPFTGNIYYGMVWRRELMPNEIMELHNNPTCFLIYPEDDVFALLVGAVAGGTTYNQSCLASSSAVAALVRQTAKPLAASSSAAASLARQTGKPLLASSTPIATLTTSRATLLSLLASSTPVAALVRAVDKIVSASSATASSLTRQTAKAASSSSAAAATVTRQTGKPLGASSTPVATLDAIRAFLLSLSASSTPVASLVRQAGKPLSATSSALATLVRATSKSLAATSGATASVVKSIAKSFTALSSAFASLLAVLSEGGVKVVTATATETLLVAATATDARVITATASEAIV